jgi:flagellar biosynthetic protein FlhB
MAEDAGNKTEEPTPKRREKAIEEGKVSRSVEVTAAAVLIAGLLTAMNRGPQMLGSLREMMRARFAAVSAVDMTPAQLGEVMADMGHACAAVVLPIVAITAIVSFGATVAQVGFRLRPKSLIPDPSKLSFGGGFKRFASAQPWIDLLKAVAKIGLVAWVTWKLIHGILGHVIALGLSQPQEIASVAGYELAHLMFWVVGTLSLVAALDYGWQRRQFQVSMRMSKGEVKDEMRQSEGDPRLRQRVKKAYRQLTRNRMLIDVPSADVVVTNPVHLAIALRYAPDAMGAPTVVAKGADELAERIKDIARRNGVPILERRALARALFRSVEIGSEIPAKLYRAVAEILAYVYALEKRRAG